MIEERYEKVDDTTMKVITTATEVKEEFLSLLDLEARKAQVLAQIDALDRDYKDNLIKLQDALAKIDKWLEESKNLGIVAIVIEEPPIVEEPPI